MQQLSSKNRLSIINFTFNGKSDSISFWSTKTNKCWAVTVSTYHLIFWMKHLTKNPKQKDLITLKKLCKNGNN